MRHGHRIVAGVLAGAVVGASLGIGACARERRGPSAATVPAMVPASVPLPTPTDPAPHEYPGIHNAVAFHDGFISGAQPEGPEAFDTLAAMGVKTIISVDGAEPDVRGAEARGIRYIHLPIGYNGFNEERRLQLARATRDARREGPVYIHCHHGKHRSAGAAASIAANLGWITPEQGVARMKVSGTAANYTGLWNCASTSTLLDDAVIEAVPASFAPVWKPSGLVAGMVEIDQATDNLKQIRKAGWKAPADHPDLVPTAEAGRLADVLRVMLEQRDTTQRPVDYVAMMRESMELASELEEMLLRGESAETLSQQLALLSTSCVDCHQAYRD